MHTGHYTGKSEIWIIGRRKVTALATVGKSTIGVPATGWIIAVGTAQISITRYPKNTYIAYKHLICDKPHPKLVNGWSGWEEVVPNVEWDKRRDTVIGAVLSHLSSLDSRLSIVERVKQSSSVQAVFARIVDYFGGEPEEYDDMGLNDWHPGHPSNFGDN